MLNSLLMTTWLCLPIAPLNPVAEDTLANVNIHLTAGATIPNGVFEGGPIISGKYELLLLHPLMARAAVDLSSNRVSSHLFPQGNLYGMTYSVEAIYYRGTEHLTGYLGAGLAYAIHHFAPTGATADSLLSTEGTTSVDVQQDFGYRFTLGLRYHRSYSFEIGVTDLRPNFKKTGQSRSYQESRRYQPTRTGSFRISLGYLFEI